MFTLTIMTTKDVNNMRYALIREMDVSNARGISVSLFVQGCHFHCKNCFNKSTWEFDGGKEWTKDVEDEFIELCKQSFIDHVSILGGEPLQQDDDLLELLKRVKKEVNKPVCLWTGYTFDKIPEKKKELLNYLDEVTDGQFIEELKDPKLKFKGSSNQNTWRKNSDNTWSLA